jgi:hypothetical protein
VLAGRQRRGEVDDAPVTRPAPPPWQAAADGLGHWATVLPSGTSRLLPSGNSTMTAMIRLSIQC